MSVAERLRSAIDESGYLSIRAFQRSIEPRLIAQHIRGSGYGSMRTYVSGRTVPRYLWMRVAAPLLNVRTEWLLDGELPIRPAGPPDRTAQIEEWAELDYTYCPHCGQALPEAGE